MQLFQCVGTSCVSMSIKCNVHILLEPKAMWIEKCVCLLVQPISENAAGKLTPFVKTEFIIRHT